MATAAEILAEQIIHVKRGRFHSFGFEPCWNSFFDFYVSPKYIEPSLLELEDVAFFLFLRKNINDTNPRWKMPSVRHMMKRVGVSQKKLFTMMRRLDEAHLLKKESGYRKGRDNANLANRYILSDPIQTLDEFLIVAAEGLFARPLKPEWHPPCITEQYRAVLPAPTPPVSPEPTEKQTSFLQQTGDTKEDRLWDAVLSTLQTQIPSASFQSFVADTRLVSMKGAVATIATPRTFAKDWLENRLSNHLRKALNLELRMRDGEQAQQVEQIAFVFLTGEEVSASR
jgi:hypothetical protein